MYCFRFKILISINNQGISNHFLAGRLGCGIRSGAFSMLCDELLKSSRVTPERPIAFEDVFISLPLHAASASSCCLILSSYVTATVLPSIGTISYTGTQLTLCLFGEEAPVFAKLDRRLLFLLAVGAPVHIFRDHAQFVTLDFDVLVLRLTHFLF